MLKKQLPTPSSPIRLYVSTSKNLNNICYTAEIIKWEEKPKISKLRHQAVRQLLKKYQPIEEEGLDDKTQTNLITIRNLQKLETQLSTSLLIKTSDKQPLKARKPPGGGWSEVYDNALFAIIESETEEINNRKLAKEIAESKKLATDVLQKRLEDAQRIPERVQIISIGFRRNADVIVTVLNRANGVCERCRKMPRLSEGRTERLSSKFTIASLWLKVAKIRLKMLWLFAPIATEKFITVDSTRPRSSSVRSEIFVATRFPSPVPPPFHSGAAGGAAYPGPCGRPPCRS